jgi:uncharacterized membrane protein YfcA
MPFIAAVVPDWLTPRAERRGGAEILGFVGTALQLICGVSGPMMDVFFVRSMMDRRTVVATKASCQVVTHMTKLVYFGGITGMEAELGPAIFILSIVMAVIGTTLSRTVLERLTDAQFRRWTKYIVLTVGAVYMAQGIQLALAG